MVISGQVAYELCRPQDLYFIWYARLLAQRFAAALLRFPPVVLVALLLPQPYGLLPPASPWHLLLFLLTLALACLLITAISMIMHTLVFKLMNLLSCHGRFVRVCGVSVRRHPAGALHAPLASGRELLPALPATAPICPFGCIRAASACRRRPFPWAWQLFWILLLACWPRLFVQTAEERGGAGRVMQVLRIYFRHVAQSMLRAAMEYRASFALMLVIQVLTPLSALAGVYFLFQNFGALQDWTLPQILLCFAVTYLSFALAECFGRGLTPSAASSARAASTG